LPGNASSRRNARKEREAVESLTDYPITSRWPPTQPDVIQLYSFPTPNGQKAGIALEELELPYEAHRVAIMDNDQKSDAFLALNPNGKIPAMIDPNGPDGTPLALFESGVILTWLAEKTGRLGGDGKNRWQVQMWLHWQIGGIGPFFGQMGHFVKFAADKVEDPYPKDRYVSESRRLLEVLDGALEGRDWVAGEFSIADIAICPWLRTAINFYEAGDLLRWDEFRNVPDYLDRFLARPAVRRGLDVPPRDPPT
jgi:GST-like protein